MNDLVKRLTAHGIDRELAEAVAKHAGPAALERIDRLERMNFFELLDVKARGLHRGWARRDADADRRWKEGGHGC